MKIQDRFGKSFQRQTHADIDFAGHTLKVYLPTRKEMLGLEDKIKKREATRHISKALQN